MATLARILSPRIRIVLAIAVVGAWSAYQLQLDWRTLVPSAAGWSKTTEFFSAALAPATDYERPPLVDTEPLLQKVARSVWRTIAFAAAAVSLALLAGLPLGFLAASAWWEQDPVVYRGWRGNLIQPAMVWATRTLISLLRSVHELLWAVLFLSAIGLNELTAVLAIAIPYTGVFAKVFSEMIDEAPRDAAYALRATGASPWQVFCFGLLPRALPDMAAYACYRFECGLRSSAVLGFFGIPTLGYYLRPAFEDQHYHEVWTYLYALGALVVAVDLWSSMMRRRLVG